VTAGLRILILGSGGQLGQELMRAAWAGGIAVSGRHRAELDICDPAAIEAGLAVARPDLVICAAAYTAVDQAEREPDRAFAVNRDAVRDIARACIRHGAALLHLSTDYVFDGTLALPYREVDPINPVSIYGRSKAEGEAAIRAILRRHLILRTSWVFGTHGQNFVKTMLRLGAERDLLRVVDDQRGCPTPAADLARVITTLAERFAHGRLTDDFPWGTYHYAGAGAVSWAEFASAVFAAAGARIAPHPRIHPIATADYPTAARRPANSVLDCGLIERRLGLARASWRSGLAAMLDETLGTLAEKVPS
jgi:dTDP-4-dehydrorhamnose reductase